MQRLEVTIKGSASEPMMLVFAAADLPEVAAERLRTLSWIVRQVGEHPQEPRRRGRADRDIAPTEPPPRSEGE